MKMGFPYADLHGSKTNGKVIKTHKNFMPDQKIVFKCVEEKV